MTEPAGRAGPLGTGGPAAGPGQLPDVLGQLTGEAAGFAERHVRVLEPLAPEDLAMWAEVAAFLTPQRVRDKRALFARMAEGLALATRRPDLRPTIHDALQQLTRRSSRLTAAYMSMCRGLAAKVTDDEFREITVYALDLSRDVDLAAALLDHAPAVIARRDRAFLTAWYEGASRVAETDWWAARGYLQAVGSASHWVHQDDLPVIADLGIRVAQRSRHAAKGLFSALPSLLASMPIARLVDWVDLGLRITTRDEELVLYMSYGSKRSQEAVEVLCRETSFSAHRARVGMILEAFLGRTVAVRSMYDVLNPASVPPDVPAFSDGSTLYVRPSLGYLGGAPLSLYKLVALHAAAHERFGSFAGHEEFDAGLRDADPLGALLDDDASRAPDDIDRFLLGVAEDFRIDAALFRTLPGLRADAARVLEETYSELDAGGPSGGVESTPPGLRAHLTAFPFGLRLLADDSLARAAQELVAPLAEQGASVEASLLAARRLRTLVSPLWEGDVPLDLVGVPYPPYHDHLLLGLTLASLSTTGTDGSGLGTPTPGASIDVPGSLHPSEVIEGLELSFRDKVQEIDPSLVAGDDEEYDDWSGEGEVFHYHEWDHHVGDHRTGWVTVRCRNLPPGDPSFVTQTVERYRGEVLLIRRQFERLRPDRIRRYFRQPDGDELDMDALIEALADRAAGVAMTDKLFIRRDKKNRDVAVLFLLDMSDSTDQLVEDNRRVIDVEKEGLVLLAEAISQLDDQYAIMGFSSRGRQQVDLFVIKDFAEAYGEDVWGRIGGIRPLDYTRLGAAIRHATSHVLQQPAVAKLLVLLSDGRPYDLGYGDMRYATEDTKMALSEARHAGVNAFCITVDPHGPDYLEDLFGANRYTVIQNVGHLPTSLPRIYRNLTV